MKLPRIALLVTVLVAVAGAVAATVLTDRLTGDLVGPQIQERVRATEAAAVAFRGIFAAAQADLGTVAEILEPWRGEPENVAAANQVVDRLGAPGVLDGLMIVDVTGVVVAADATLADQVGQRALGDLVAVTLTGESAVGGPVLLTGARAHVGVSSPLRDDRGVVAGALVGLLRSDGQLARLTDALDAGESQRLILAWRDGTAIEADGTTARDRPAAFGAQLTGRGLSSERTLDPAGRDLLVTAAAVTGDWSVVSYQPVEVLEGGLDTPVLLVVVALGAVAIAVVATVVLQQRRVRAARAELEDAQQALLAVAGHELRTPLTIVGGITQTLDRYWDTLPDSGRHELVGTAEKHVRTLRYLVERLLFAARLQHGASGSIATQVTDVADLVERAVDDHRPLAPTHTFELALPARAMGQVDPRALDQVLFHLLDNAVKYSPAGGTVWVTVEGGGPTVDIIIDDEGVGLPADTQRLFRRFGQVEEVDTRVLAEGGVGLGLYIVRSLVELQGGTVDARNRDPVGARFVVSLPAGDARTP